MLKRARGRPAIRRLRGYVHPPRLTGTFLHPAAHRRLTLFDLIIRNGTIIDGTRADRYPADIGLRADRIAAIGNLRDTESQHSIDAQGKIVRPRALSMSTTTPTAGSCSSPTFPFFPRPCKALPPKSSWPMASPTPQLTPPPAPIGSTTCAPSTA